MVVIRGCIIDRGCLIVFAFLSLFMFIILYEYLSLLDLTKFKGELDDFVNSVQNVSIVNSTVITNGRLYIESDSSDTKSTIESSSTDGLQDQWMSAAAATAPPSSAVSLKILKVIGISMAGGCLVFLFPVALFLILAAIGFTGAGIALGSCAACCQSGIGAVAAGSWFAIFQSIGPFSFFLLLWVASWPVIGWFVWPLV